MHSPHNDGHPLGKLIESYVLSAIGELSPESHEQLAQMTPRLRAAFHASGDWRSIVRQILGFDEEYDRELRAAWARNQLRANALGDTYSEYDYAKAVAAAILASGSIAGRAIRDATQ